jgi:hypothetical protein
MGDDAKQTPDSHKTKDVTGALPDTIEFYPAPVVASIVTSLMLTVNRSGAPSTSFESALIETRDLARSSPSRGEQDLADLLTVVITFFQNGNQQLFLDAHAKIQTLLQGLVGTGEWSPCLAVSRNNVLDIARLPRH